MFLGIITTAGKGGPFKRLETAPDPVEKLRLDESATLVSFTHQNTRTFATSTARAYNKILWHVTPEIMHPDDMPPTIEFVNLAEFTDWIREKVKCENTEPC